MPAMTREQAYNARLLLDTLYAKQIGFQNPEVKVFFDKPCKENKKDK